jgi:hypothetical protein
MLILFIIGLILILIGFIFAGATNVKQEDFLIGFLTCFLLGVGTAVVCITGLEIWDPQPDAIDVYRNKTELEIIYKVVGIDTLSRDTTVVFKQYEN